MVQFNVAGFGFGITLQEVQYIVFGSFLALLAFNVFLVTPNNVFTAIEDTGAVFFPTGAEIAALGDNFDLIMSQGSWVNLIQGVINILLGGIILVAKTIISLTFLYTLFGRFLIPFYNFINGWD